jgi:hypothetical protein
MGSILGNLGTMLFNNDNANTANANQLSPLSPQANDTSFIPALSDQLNKLAQGDKAFNFNALLSAMAPKDIQRRSFGDMSPNEKKNFIFNLGQSMIQNSSNNNKLGVGTALGMALGDASNQDIGDREKRQQQLQQLMKLGTDLAPKVGEGQRGVEQLGLTKRGQDLDQDYKNRALLSEDAYRKGSVDIQQQGLENGKYIPLGTTPDGKALILNQKTGEIITSDMNANLKGSKAPQIPQSILNKVSANDAAANKIDQALNLVGGIGKDAFGYGGYAAQELGRNYFSSPENIAARAAVADIGSGILHDRSGAAVTISEFPRFKPFIPVAGDTADIIKTKLEHLKNAIDTETAAYKDNLKNNGYQVDAYKNASTSPSTSPSTTNNSQPSAITPDKQKALELLKQRGIQYE